MDPNNDSHELRLELENVQSVIQLTKENIDALNDRFKKFNPPPRIYLDEYNDLTTKLHHLKSLEQSLVDKISALYEHQQEVSRKFPLKVEIYRICTSLRFIYRWKQQRLKQIKKSSELIFLISSEHRFPLFLVKGSRMHSQRL